MSKQLQAINLKHRLSEYDSKFPTSVCLFDSINNATDRAEAIIHLLQNEFIGEGQRLDDSSVFNLLESVRLDLVDVKAVAEHYHESQKQQA
jgi:hypothetical protein